MHVIKLDATDSTNDHLRQMLLANKLTTPTVVWSLFQKKGKGQRGQVWTSKAGENLMFSLYIPSLTSSADQLFSIHKIVSVCLADWLLSLQIPNISVKWPNDILSGNKKLAGILVESSIQKSMAKSIIIGMGINVNQIQFPQLPNATSMRLCTAKTYDSECPPFVCSAQTYRWINSPEERLGCCLSSISLWFEPKQAVCEWQT